MSDFHINTKSYLLVSRLFVDDESEQIKNKLAKCKLPPFILSRIKRVYGVKKQVASSWRESFRFGRIGRTAESITYFVEMNTTGLSEAQDAVISGFWNGFLSGRDSKSFNL